MTEFPDRPEVKLQITVLDSDRVEIWTRDGLHRTDLAFVLRTMAHKFERGDVTRVDHHSP